MRGDSLALRAKGSIMLLKSVEEYCRMAADGPDVYSLWTGVLTPAAPAALKLDFSEFRPLAKALRGFGDGCILSFVRDRSFSTIYLMSRLPKRFNEVASRSVWRRLE